MDDVEEFAAALTRVRRHAGLSYRRLAERAHYSHPHLIRATNGAHLPSWEVASAFLTGCGVPDDLLPLWHARWQAATRDPQDILELLGKASSTTALGHALAALTRPHSSRQLEQLSGIPRATVQAWLQGTRLPPRDRLDVLIRSVGATTAERAAVARAVQKISSGRQPVAPAA